MRIEEIDLTDGEPASEAWLEVHHAAGVDTWGPEAQRTSVAEVLHDTERRGEVRRTFTAYDGDVAVGALQTIRSTHDNTETGNLWLSVLPGHQRRGVGSALLARAEEALRSGGCTRVLTYAGSPRADGGAARPFALARGYRETLVEVRQDLELPVPQQRVDALRPDLGAAYAIETAVDELPEEWLEDRAVLANRMSTDAPAGDVDLDEEQWDAERVRRQWNSGGAGRGFAAVARHVATGRLVGYTDLVVRPATPTLAVQADTLVLREHRGHTLGLAMKLANLESLQRALPEVRTVRTWNAESNTPMLAVNERIGFRGTGWTRDWLKEL